ncbi:MAG: lysylphosphatidylglycerol synthase domain-containing protein [Dokdonella sp.]|uniref:lysylphosphatidylglycerol synthase domain-containing protein n=1 Tax=Dokdonella sp. TaxID=2291710 RepID=UPI003F7F0D88
MDAPAARAIVRRSIEAGRWIFGPAALACLALAAWHARDTIGATLAGAEPLTLLAAIALWALSHAFAPVTSRIVLGNLGVHIRYRELLAIHVSRLPARYLPGGIWHTVSRVVDLQRRGVGRAELAAMVLAENILPPATAGILGGVLLFAAGVARTAALVAVAAGAALLVVATVLSRHAALRRHANLAPRALLRAAGASAAFWCMAAAAFALYWLAFADAGGEPLGAIAGVYLVSWAVGFVSFFAPQGLGVFEGVAALFLADSIGLADAAVLAAGFRVVVLAADLTAWSILQAWRGARRARLN